MSFLRGHYSGATSGLASLESALFADPYINGFDINVRAKDGTVTLTGTVDVFIEKAVAGDTAASVTGVNRVINKINVYEDTGYYRYDVFLYPGAPLIAETDIYRPLVVPDVTNPVLKSRIGSELFWSPFVDHDQVTVTVNDDVVALTGTVDSWREFRAATDNAYDGGASLVYIELIVE